jgi:hypothetical protein
MRQVNGGDVAHERANDLVIAHAAVQPAEKKHELYTGGNDGGQNGVPMDGHGIPCAELISANPVRRKFNWLASSKR